ncbi:MAG: hypothetical protein EXQ52_06885 [Bryobacterales bacterium]|nr:hypothetical protein [Bryobacterales bacterium]
MTLSSWRIRRALVIEHGIMESARTPIIEASPAACPISRIAAAFAAPTSTAQLDLVNRCEARFHRTFHRALNNLLTLRD